MQVSNPPDADVVWEHYLETCRRLGVEPVPRDRAHELIAEWSETLTGRRPGPPQTRH